MNSPSDDFDPARLETASFEMVRRGFDPTAVKGELQRAAQEIRRVRLERDEFAGRLAEFDGITPDKLEAHRVAEALGVEATQVLESAHRAATERAERAEREAEAVREDAIAAAEATRSEAEAAREETLENARREAERIAEDGRERGREMVAEAQTVRERMLSDLARKRQTGRAQVEQLRAARDRLMESLTVAQQGMDSAVVDLVNTVPEARAAAERAGLRVMGEATPTIDQLEGEIESARLVGHPLVDDLVDGDSIDETFTTGEMEALTDLDVLDSDIEVRVPPIEGAVATDLSDDTDVSDEAEGADDTAASDDTESDDTESDESDDTESDDTQLYDVEAEDEVEAEDGEADPDSDIVLEEFDPDEADVDDVFARLRESQGADTEAEDAPAAEDKPAAEDATAAEDEPAADDTPEPEPEPEVESGTLDPTRSEARTSAMHEAAKVMKKVLVEEQGTLLDGIRRSGAEALSLVTDDPSAHAAPYEKAAAPALKELASALGGSKRLGLGAANAQIQAIALEPVRARLAEVAERVDDADELSDTVRALYRESRSRRIPEAAEAAAVAVDGLVAIATAESTLEWRVVPGGPCGPDCADNALAGPVKAGDAFPTGDKHPPAHAACTCWLEPTTTG